MEESAQQEESTSINPLKIVYVAPRFLPFKAGAEQNIYALSSRMAKEGHDITVITTNVKYRNEELPKEEVLEGMKIIRNWALNNQLYAGFYPGFLSTILKTDADVIHSTGIGFLWREMCLIIKKVRSKNTKFIVTPHGPFMALGDKTGFRGFARKIMMFFLRIYISRLYDAVIAVNPKQEKWLMEDYKFKKENIYLVPNGIDESYLEKEIIQHPAEDKVVITYMNRMEWYKGIQDVIRAIDKLLDKRAKVEDNFVFYVMGKAGGYTQKLKDMVEELNLQEYVKFIFHPTDEERDRIFYKESQINILPSKWEATGITLIEAMAKGNAIITTSSNEAAEILIEEGKSGFIYDFGDVEELKGILRKLLLDTKLRREMRERNLELAKKFTWEGVMPAYRELIKKLIINN